MKGANFVPLRTVHVQHAGSHPRLLAETPPSDLRDDLWLAMCCLLVWLANAGPYFKSVVIAQHSPHSPLVAAFTSSRICAS